MKRSVEKWESSEFSWHFTENIFLLFVVFKVPFLFEILQS
jgi:hypothetical protein